jgi:hypothetical protein
MKDDDKRNGNGRGGSGGEGTDDGADFAAGHDDETVVIVSDEYTRGVIGRLADGLRAAAALCDGFRSGGEAASREEKVAILGELRERVREIRMHAEGTERGIARLEREELARQHAEKRETK